MNFISSAFGEHEDLEEIGSDTDQVRLFIICRRLKECPSMDPLGWWRKNSSRFPAITELERDVFSIQASSVESESACSTAGRIMTIIALG